MRKFATVGVGVFLVAILSDAWAQERDYSAGFAPFYQLGLPKATGAHYVRLHVNRAEFPPHSGINLTGNAWLLREDEQKGTFIHNNCTELEVWRQAVIQQEWQDKSKGEDPMQMHRLSMAERRAYGSWQPVDVDTEINTINQHLDEVTKTMEALGATGARAEMMMREDMHGHGIPHIFFFCAHLAESGRRQEANVLLERLFKVTAPAEIIAAGLNALADARHQEALSGLLDSGDWNALHAAVANVRDDFGNHWRMAPAVAILLHKIEERLQQGIAELSGETLTAEHRRLARELAETPVRQMQVPHGMWFLPSPHRHLTASGVVARIQAAGVEALPLLIAMIDDETLIPARMSRYYGSHSSRGSRGPTAEDLYRSLPRPVTRGEVARSLLQQVVPEEDATDPLAMGRSHRGTDVDHAELRKRAEELYTQLQGKSDAEIIFFCLASTTGNVRLEALAAVLQLPKLDDYAADIEALLLGWETSGDHGRFAMQIPHYVAQYVAKRGGASRDFGEKYLARCQEQLAALKAPKDAAAATSGVAAQPMFVKQTDERQIRQLETVVKQIQDALSDKSLEDILQEAIDGSRDMQSVHTAVSRYAAMPRNETVPAILKAALAADVPEKTIAILQMALYLGMARHVSGVAAEQAEPYLPAADKALWEKLLADRREVSQYFMTVRVSMTAASTIESLCGSERAAHRGFEHMQSLPADRLERAFVVRARARLDGKTEAELPDIMPVADPGKGAAVAARLADIAADQLPEFLEALPDDEYVSLLELAQKDAAIRDRFAPMARKISRAEGNVDGLELAVGSHLTTEALKTVVEHLRSEALEGKKRQLTIQRQNPGGGFVIKEGGNGENPFGGMWSAEMMGGKLRVAMIHGMVMAGDQHGTGTWAVKLPPPETAKEPAAGDELETIPDRYLDQMLKGMEATNRFWPIIEAILDEPAADLFRPVTITLFLTQPGEKKAETDDF